MSVGKRVTIKIIRDNNLPYTDTHTQRDWCVCVCVENPGGVPFF